MSDFANVLDPASRQQIESYCAQVEQATGVQFAIVTVSSLNGAPVEDTANSLFRRWGIGKKGKDEGLLLLLATQDHKDRIEVGYGLEPILPDGFAGSITRNMRPALQQGNYGQALLSATQEMGTRIAQSKGVSLDLGLPPLRPRTRIAQPSRGIPWPLILIGLFILFGLFNRGGRGGGGGGLLTGMILGNMMGGSRGWGGGGGFGGYDGGGGGGGGFGGFGGGDSGGGGASGSW